MPSKPQTSLMKEAISFCEKAVLSTSGELTKEQWESCFNGQQGIMTTCAISAFELGRDSMSVEGVPDKTILEAMERLWIQPAQPQFLGNVIVSVRNSVFIYGKLHRLSHDVPMRSLACALFKTKEDRDVARYELLFKLAQKIPIELRYTDSEVDAWFAAQHRTQLKQLDAKFEQSTCLAYGHT